MEAGRSEGRTAVAREMLRQAERILDTQQKGIDSAVAGAAGLLRLVVASVAGVIVITAALISVRISVPPEAYAGVMAGVVLMVFAGYNLAAIMAGASRFGPVALGPHPDRLVALLEHGTEENSLVSLAAGSPTIIKANQLIYDQIQAAKGRALLSLTLGDILVLAALIYMGGGYILG